MKHLFITLSFIALTIVNVMADDRYNYDYTRGGIYYRYVYNPNKQAVVTYANSWNGNYYHLHTKPSGELVIPNPMTESGSNYSSSYTVISIDNNAFRGCIDLTSVIISDGISSIGYNAFGDCSGLTSITIPNSVTTIGSGAFLNCTGLTSITIPNSITTIESSTFSGCSSLTSLNIPNTVTSISEYVFAGCSSLESIELSENITEISNYMFSDCSNLASINIPNSVTTIGIGAFTNCSILETITIPNTVTRICNNAFSGCSSLTSVTIPNSITRIGKDAFAGCDNLQYYEYDNALYLGNDENHFLWLIKAKSTDITSCMINNNCKFIADYAFDGCSNLSLINIPNSVIGIGDEAFINCSGLSMVTIPKSVIYIGQNAFSNSNITIYCEPQNKPNGWYYSNSYGTITDWHSNAGTVVWGVKASITDDFVFYATDTISRQCGVYKYVGNDTDVEIPSKAYFDGNEYAVTSIGYEVFDDYTDLLSVTIPESVRSIDESAFRGCTGLTSITLPDSLVSIGYSAFYGCTGLTTIDIPNSVTTFGDYAFAECTGLTSVTLPDSITDISRCMFENCEGLTSMIIPNTVTKIKEEAFSGCSNLKLVIIPKSVAAIERIAFNSNKITFYCEHEPTPDYWVSNWNSNRGTIFWNVEHKGDYIFRVTDASSHQAEILKYIGADSVLSIPASVTFGSTAHTVTTISESAFKGCNNMKSVTIPDVVVNIGDSAFYGCSRLPQIVIPNSVAAMGQGAFGDCSSLTIYCIATSKPKQWQADWNPDDYPVVWGTKIDGDFIYQITNAARREISIVKYAGKDSVLAIPSKPIINSLECSITRIGDYAFAECDSLVRITIPNSVQNIGDYAFAGCSRLSEVVIGSGIASIGESAFSECGAVSTIKIGNATPPTISESTFDDVDKWITIDVPCPNIDAYKDSDYWGDFVNYYEPPVYAVTVKAENSKCGNVTITRQPTCDNNQAVFEATSNTGFAFDHWNDGNTENPRTVAVTKDTSFTAFYSAAKINVSITTANATQGSVTDLSGIHYYSDEITISATANYGYHFTRWSDSVTANPRTIVLRGDTVIQAQFAANQYAIIVGCNNEELGTVSGGGTFDYLATASISATANHGYAFKQWNDGNYDNPRRVTITQDTAFTAVFVPDEVSVSVVSADTARGKVSALSGTHHYYDTITFSVTANYGYHFAYWSDSVTANPRTIVLRGDTAIQAQFAANQYSITVGCNNAELGSVSGGGTFDYLATASISATANHGYAFKQWNDGNYDNPRSVAITRDTAFTAVFVPDEVSVSVVSADTVRGKVSALSGTHHYYDTITVSATANYGYHFTTWSDNVTTNPRTIILRGDTAIQAQFAANQYSITVGSNNEELGTVSGGGTFNYLATASISATANHGYAFKQWNDGNYDNPRRVTITCDTAFTAVFVPDEVNVEVKSADTEHGTVTELSGVYHFNEKIIISAIAVPHYHFVAWSDGNRQNPREVLLRGDTVLTAAFGIDTFSVAAKCDTAMGAVSGAGLYSYGSAAKVEAKPAAHHHFVRWANGAAQTTQEFVVEHDTAFEAVFAIDRHSVALAASDSLCGAVSGAGSYDYGASVQLQATPAANCYFTGWSDGVTTNPRTLTVESDTTIVAEFGKLQTVNIMVAANDTLRGTVAGTGSYVVGSNATLSATASAHYLFEQWSDGRTDNPRTVRVIADATYTAVFVPMQYNIILSQNNADMGMVSGSGVYSYGERVSCLAKPYPNYHFVQWSNGETSNPYEFVVEEDKMLTAYFAAGAVTAIGDESATQPTIYAVGKTIVVENATDEICVYDAMGKLICRDAIHRVRTEIRVNTAGVYIVKTGNVIKRVMIND